jgi:hypothetical protein
MRLVPHQRKLRGHSFARSTLSGLPRHCVQRGSLTFEPDKWRKAVQHFCNNVSPRQIARHQDLLNFDIVIQWSRMKNGQRANVVFDPA